MGYLRDRAYAAFDAARRLARATRAATAVESGLIMALVVLAMLVALNETATVTIRMWNDTSTKVQNAR